MSRFPESLRAHVVAPRHTGEPAGGFTHRGEASNAACRDHLVLYLRVEAGGRVDGARVDAGAPTEDASPRDAGSPAPRSPRVAAAGFRATGCPAVLGTASAAAELLHGMAADASLAATLRARFVAAHGEPAPLHRHAWALVDEALRAAWAGG